MGLLMLLVATAVLLGYCQTDEKVSFYGASYIHFPVQEAKGGTDISFRFRTHLPDAILLLAAGKTDYCLIKLEAGRLKVHINLGAGESEMASPVGLTLNDLTWHDVNITRREANITLQIDVIHTTRSILPGRFFELNIHYGVYIGGLGYFTELFLGHTEYLRGCMADIMYNGARVVEYAKSRRSKSEATAITWGCSAEFDASRDVAVSFVEDGAFTSIPRPIPRQGSRWEFELKTGSDSGMLLYNTGHASYADYLGIELQNGNIRVVMNKGNGPSELTHTRNITDGKWHRASIDFNPAMITIRIDDDEKRMNLPAGGNRYLDLAETLYIGGTELNKRARAIAKGLNSGDRSYKGCLRHMILDGKPLGLPDVKVSQGIVAGCVWRYPCLMDRMPCRRDAICRQIGVGSFACDCEQRDTCVNDDYVDDNAINGSSNLPVNLDILSLTQLSVFEGEKVSVTRNNIEMIMDIARYDLNEGEIKIIVITTPSHGTMNQETRMLARNSSFTLRDVNMEKIRYVHDGSESTEDGMILELRLASGVGLELPSYLRGGLRFPLHVNITPVNDPPVLEIPTTKVLRLAQGTRRTLSKELVWTMDPDTPSEMLTYTVLGADTDAGHVERPNEPGISVVTFTQAELLRGTVAYVHCGNAKTNAQLGLQVSDGMANSQSGFLRISAYPLQIKLINNTGLVVVHRSFTHLRSSNLSFATNSDDASIEILYDIVALPVYGLLQKFNNSSGSWTSIERFTSRDIENENIRYLHNHDSPSTDEFKFQASVREVRTQQNFDFRINFIDLELRETTRRIVNFTNAIETAVSTENLKYQTNPLITYPSMIRYTIISSTKYGNALLADTILRDADSFTQEDIDTGRLRYRLFKSAYSPIHDELLFQVSAPQCQSIVSNLSLIHRAGKKGGQSFEHRETLSVDEGSDIAIKIILPDAKIHGVDKVLYNVTLLPRNGWLSVDSRDSGKKRDNATYFTSDELNNDNVYYHHDDSETVRDAFGYVAVASDETDFMYAGQFDVRIKLKNDNPPSRRTMKDFHIVTSGERLLTCDDLSYNDTDTGTRSYDLVYRPSNTSNADAHRIDAGSASLAEFTQQDVNDRKIMLRHHGDDSGFFEFTITDGHWLINDKLRVIASRPYVNFLTGNATVVRFNASAVLTVREIDVRTNVNANDREIKFNIIGRPKHGGITRNGRETTNFSRDDLTRETIVYRHNGDSLSKDDFKIRAHVRNVSTETRITVRVYGKSYWEPLIVRNNRTILVEETTSVVLSRKSLELQHPNITPAEIVYFVRERPKYGYLEIQQSITDEAHADETTRDDDDSSLVRHFDQSMINDGRICYVQSMINHTQDHIVVDVTNGVTWTRGITIRFVIIPDKIYVDGAGNLTVFEGKSVPLGATNFRVSTSYYMGKITDYRIIGKPKHGSIVDTTSSNQIKKFSQKHLNSSVIIYKHNGDEFPYDDLRIIAIAGDKTSGPINLRINVIPINDEFPVLINHTIVSVWQGGSVAINSTQLASLDNDTGPNELVYNLTSVKNGYLWHNDTPHVYIYNFTQAQIDHSKIIFTHTNGTSASFSFVLFDGVHSTSNYEITIMTVPVHLTVRVNDPLNVFPLTRKTITSMLLVTACTDTKRDVTYIVGKRPSLGKIIMETSEGTWQEVDRFTQNDVNASRVTYEHTKQFMDLSTNDSFVFDVETHFAEIISNQVFRIDVSVSSGGLDRYITARTVHVEEGGSANVAMNITGIVKYLRTKAGIESPIVMSRLNRQPDHGHVMLIPDLNITTFDQQQIENDKIAYYHDHSDTLEDHIYFSIYLSPGHIMLCNSTINIVVSPLNDQPFKLITNEPSITVVQNQTRTIKRENLLTIDPDTGPDGLIYDLISGPTCGRLLLVPYEQNTSDIRPVEQWSQRDIDANRLVYEHNGTTQAASFYFRVWDQSFNPVYKLFNVQVLPIRLSIEIIKSVSLPQGSNMADITENNIRLDTNARQEQVFYEITRSPRHGVLYVRDVAAVKFRHADLLSRSVIFVQTDMNVSNDSFALIGGLSNHRTREMTIEITVVPLMIIHTMIAIAGEKTRMTRRHMDATPLAELTRSTPQYRITRKSKYCKIKRIIRSYGDKSSSREREVTRFTHTEIISEVIYVVCRRLPPAELNGLTDSFEFSLAALSYQPAIGILLINVRNNSGDANGTSLSGPMDPVGHEGEMAVAPNTSNDYILIIGMLLGVFLLGIVVIITIRCRHNRYKHNNDEDKRAEPGPTAVGVIPLPRPPDHLMPATSSRHNLKRFGDHTSGVTSSTPLPVQSSTNATSTLPQCKVIPLSALDSVTGSEADVSARYPYGVADADEWSSFDTGELPCHTATTRRPNPLLRRNQYWV